LVMVLLLLGAATTAKELIREPEAPPTLNPVEHMNLGEQIAHVGGLEGVEKVNTVLEIATQGVGTAFSTIFGAFRWNSLRSYINEQEEEFHCTNLQTIYLDFSKRCTSHIKKMLIGNVHQFEPIVFWAYHRAGLLVKDNAIQCALMDMGQNRAIQALTEYNACFAIDSLKEKKRELATGIFKGAVNFIKAIPLVGSIAASVVEMGISVKEAYDRTQAIDSQKENISQMKKLLKFIEIIDKLTYYCHYSEIAHSTFEEVNGFQRDFLDNGQATCFLETDWAHVVLYDKFKQVKDSRPHSAKHNSFLSHLPDKACEGVAYLKRKTKEALLKEFVDALNLMFFTETSAVNVIAKFKTGLTSKKFLQATVVVDVTGHYNITESFNMPEEKLVDGEKKRVDDLLKQHHDHLLKAAQETTKFLSDRIAPMQKALLAESHSNLVEYLVRYYRSVSASNEISLGARMYFLVIGL